MREQELIDAIRKMWPHKDAARFSIHFGFGGTGPDGPIDGFQVGITKGRVMRGWAKGHDPRKVTAKAMKGLFDDDGEQAEG